MCCKDSAFCRHGDAKSARSGFDEAMMRVNVNFRGFLNTIINNILTISDSPAIGTGGIDCKNYNLNIG